MTDDTVSDDTTPEMAMPPQMVADWIKLAVRYQDASGRGCPECRGGIPSDAKARGHVDCAMDLAGLFAAYSFWDFLMQPAECWFGLAAAPETTEALGE